MSPAERIARDFALQQHVAELERLLADARDLHEHVLTEAEFEPHVRRNMEQANKEFERAAEVLTQMLARWEKVDAGIRSLVASAVSGKREGDADPLTLALRAAREEAVWLREVQGGLSYGPGAPRELPGLHAIARLVAPFWERVKGTRFAHNNRATNEGGAQGFLLAIATALDPGAGYTLENCNSVMRGRRRARRGR